MCNSSYQCVNIPCHQHDPDIDDELTVCPSHVNRTKYKVGIYTSWFETTVLEMYHCEEENECRIKEVPCGGACLFDLEIRPGRQLEAREQVACKDGSKCINFRHVCDNVPDCDDGSDEDCTCRGNINCKERIRFQHSWRNIVGITGMEFRCLSNDLYIELSDYCDGKVDCDDGSDEDCDECPGIAQCWNGDLVCGDVPCNNTGVKLKHINDGLQCKAESTRKDLRFRLCEDGDGDVKCVKVSVLNGNLIIPYCIRKF